jgi:hypothetical protein
MTSPVDGAPSTPERMSTSTAEAVALVAAELAGASERREERDGENLAGIGGGPRPARRVPSPRGWACPPRRDAELAHGPPLVVAMSSTYGSRPAAGAGHADRIRAHHGLRPKVGAMATKASW